MTCLKREQLLIEVIRLQGRDTRKILLSCLISVDLCFLAHFILSILSILALLDSLTSKTVSDVCHDDEHEEESKGKIGFPLLNDPVKEDNVEPDIGDDRPAGGDRENACIRNFLNAPLCTIIVDIRIRPLIVIIVH